MPKRKRSQLRSKSKNVSKNVAQRREFQINNIIEKYLVHYLLHFSDKTLEVCMYKGRLISSVYCTMKVTLKYQSTTILPGPVSK